MRPAGSRVDGFIFPFRNTIAANSGVGTQTSLNTALLNYRKEERKKEEKRKSRQHGRMTRPLSSRHCAENTERRQQAAGLPTVAP